MTESKYIKYEVSKTLIVKILRGVFEKMSDDNCPYCTMCSYKEGVIEFTYGNEEGLIDGSAEIGKKTIKLTACKDFIKEFRRKLKKQVNKVTGQGKR